MEPPPVMASTTSEQQLQDEDPTSMPSRLKRCQEDLICLCKEFEQFSDVQTQHLVLRAISIITTLEDLLVQSLKTIKKLESR